MSGFEFEGENEQPKEQPRAEQPRARAREERTEQQPPARRGLSLSALSQSQHRTSIGAISDIAMQTITTVFEKSRDHESPNLPAAIRRNKFKLLPVIGQGSTQDPALVVSLDLTSDGINKTLIYILLLEQPDAVQQTRLLSEGREQYESLITPEDQMNERLYKRIESQYPDSEVVIVNYQVVLSEITRVLASGGEIDSQVQNVVANIMNNAIDALSGTRERVIAELTGQVITDVALTPASVDGNIRMEVVYDYPVTVTKDGSGLPIGADVVGRVYFSSPVRDEFDQNSIDRTLLGSVSATLDLYLDDGDEEQYNRYGVFGRKPQGPEPFWQAVLDVRGLGGSPNVPYSLEQAIYQLAQITPLTNDHRWIRALSPRNAVADQKGVVNSLVDLGWLNYYNPNTEAGGYIDDITANTPEDVLVEYLAGVVKPEIAVGMTLPNSNDKSWILSIFEQIATESDERIRTKLVQNLYRAINVLTGDRFLEIASDRMLDKNYSPIFSTGVRELIGVWIDDNGNERALSEWNVAAFATRLADRTGAADIVREYQMTFETGSGRSADYQLTERFEMLRRYATGTARVTGTAEKHVFDTEFLSALSASIANTSLEPFLTNADNLTRRQRVGHTVYRSHAGGDLGHSGRRREEGGYSRTRSVYRGDRRFY